MSDELGFPYETGGMLPSNYLLHLLLALIRKHGGKVTLKANAIQAIPSGAALVKTINLQKSELTLEYAQSQGELFFVESKGKCQPRTPVSIPSRPRSSLTSPMLPTPPANGYKELETEYPETERELLERLHPERKRKAVLDEATTFLRDSEMRARIAKRTADVERQQRFREGTLPFRTVPGR